MRRSPVAAVGALVALVGAWVFFAPLVGPTFGFGLDTGSTWSLSHRHWVVNLAAGIGAMAAGLALLAAPRLRAPAIVLGLASAAWLAAGPSVYPLVSAGAYEVLNGPDWKDTLRWIGDLYGPAVLLAFLCGYGAGLPAPVEVARAVPADGPEAEPPLEDTRTAPPYTASRRRLVPRP